MKVGFALGPLGYGPNRNIRDPFNTDRNISPRAFKMSRIIIDTLIVCFFLFCFFVIVGGGGGGVGGEGLLS